MPLNILKLLVLISGLIERAVCTLYRGDPARYIVDHSWISENEPNSSPPPSTGLIAPNSQKLNFLIHGELIFQLLKMQYKESSCSYARLHAEGLIISTYRSVKCANASYKVAYMGPYS